MAWVWVLRVRLGCEAAWSAPPPSPPPPSRARLPCASLRLAAGDEEAREMADAEQHLMAALGWEGQGLIAAAGAAVHAGGDSDDGEEAEGEGREGGGEGSSSRGVCSAWPVARSRSAASLPAPSAAPTASTPRLPPRAGADVFVPGGGPSSSSSPDAASKSKPPTWRASPEIRLLALDMDGTLLDRCVGKKGRCCASLPLRARARARGGGYG